MGGAEIKSFRNLDVWQVAMELAVAAYGVAGRLPSTERFELSAQIRRAAVSIPPNVAEGHSSGRDGRYLQHVLIACGSLGELETHFELTERLHLATAADLAGARELVTRVGQLLYGVARSLRKRRRKTTLSCIAVVFVCIGLATLVF
jgi:four helix bundle protein